MRHDVARRIVAALPTATGMVLVRDRCGRDEIVDAVVGACVGRGLDPVVERVSNEVLRELIGSRSPAELAMWDVERAAVAEQVDGLIVLGGWPADLDGLPAASVAAWSAAVGRVESALEGRHVPTVVCAIPTMYVADRLGTTAQQLDERVLPSLLVPDSDLRADIDRLVTLLRSSATVRVDTSAGSLHLQRGGRPVMTDDGVIDDADIAAGAVVSNLPAGSLYWTVIEHATRGAIALTDGSVLEFDGDGRVRDGRYAGERVSHVGIGTNPKVSGEIGWTIVDEHRPGAVFLALGENRYMGGENESAINVDLMPDSPTVVFGETIVVEAGSLPAH
ncbi:MAG: hypothetical protein AB7L17_13795 [Ilumatobacteraceae bacterium]